jgi:uncharacterized protein (TIGR03437 family)
MSAAPSPKTLGQRKVAVLLVNFQNDQRQLIDSITASSLVLGGTNSYYQENSYGNLSIVGDVYGYLTLPLQTVCRQIFNESGIGPGFTDIQDAAVTAAQSARIDLSGYDSILVLGPELQTCDGGEAAATIGGGPGYAILKLQDGQVPAERAHVVAHELGHNMGLHHARYINGWSTPTTYNGTVPAVECLSTPLPYCYDEYGDGDVMGISQPTSYHFNAVFKELLGWLQPHIVDSTGTYTIEAYELVPQALKILPLQGGDSFYIECRRQLGFDFDLSFSGPTFHVGGNPSYLLHLNPGLIDLVPYGSLVTAGLFPGQTYTDYANRFSVTNLSMSPAGAQLRILIPGIDSPTLAFTAPADGATVWGTASISIDALDLAAISRVDISLDGSPLTSLTAPPYTFAWNAANAALGQHVLGATAYNTQGNTASQQITVTVSPQQIGGLLDGASFLPDVAPGSIVSLFISGFSLPTATATMIPLSNNLGDASVTIASQALPFFYVSSTQLNVQLPWDLPAGANTVTVSGGGVSATSTFNVVPAAPGIFLFGNNRAVAQNQDGTLNDVGNPAQAGSYVTVYMTGIGPLDNPVVLGAATPLQPLSRATTAATATVGGTPAQIYFIGMTPLSVGLAQADIQIPPTLAPGTYPIQVQIGDLPTGLSNTPLITTN